MAPPNVTHVVHGKALLELLRGPFPAVQAVEFRHVDTVRTLLLEDAAVYEAFV